MVRRANYTTGLDSGASVCMQCKGLLDGEMTIEWGKMKGTAYRYIGTFCSYDCQNVWVGENGDQSGVVVKYEND